MRSKKDIVTEYDPEGVDIRVEQSRYITDELKDMLGNQVYTTASILTDLDKYGSTDNNKHPIDKDVIYIESKPCNKYMNGTFSECSMLLLSESLDISKVVRMNATFRNCYGLLAQPHLYATDQSVHTEMVSLFNNCYIIPKIDFYNLPHLTSLASCFKQCNSLNEVILADDMPYLTNLGELCMHSCQVERLHLPKSCPNVTSLVSLLHMRDAAGGNTTTTEQEITVDFPDELPNLTNFNRIFMGLHKKINGTFPRIDPTKIENMYLAFSDATMLTTDNIRNLLGVEYTKNMSITHSWGGMFNHCTGLTGQIDFWIPNTQNAYAIFQNCTNVDIFNVDFKSVNIA